jgi:superfamily I DNA/RNA helicase
MAHAENAGTDCEGFLERLTLQSDADVYHPRAEKAALMTMHASKGLEFPVVIIAGCETGFIPYNRSNQEPDDVEEERRLFYVAMTRARQRLYLTHAKRRHLFGKTEDRELSFFARNIAPDLLTSDSAPIKPRSPKADQLQLF